MNLLSGLKRSNTLNIFVQKLIKWSISFKNRTYMVEIEILSQTGLAPILLRTGSIKIKERKIYYSED